MLKILDKVMGPVEGVTLALDFANNGKATLDLMQPWDIVVLAAGGLHQQGYSTRLAHFQQKACHGLDPGCSCGFVPENALN